MESSGYELFAWTANEVRSFGWLDFLSLACFYIDGSHAIPSISILRFELDMIIAKVFLFPFCLIFSIFWQYHEIVDDI